MKPLSFLARPLGRSLALTTGLLLGLVPGGRAQPNHYNTGHYTNAGNTYHAAGFSNSGAVTNIGAGATTNTFAATGVAFLNIGSYTYVVGAPNPVTDQFVGAGSQTLAGTVAPQFDNLTLANPSTTTFDLTNTAGLDVAGTLTLSNGKTTTTGGTTPPGGPADVAGALRLGPAAGLAGNAPNSTTYIDGFVGKAGAAGFTYPLGATPAGTVGGSGASPVSSPLYSPITLSNPAGTTLRYVAGASAPPSSNTFAPQGGGLQLARVSTLEYYPLYAPVGGGLNTSITLPYTNFGPTGYVGSPSQLTIAGFDGTQWVNLSTTSANVVANGAVTVTVAAGTDLSGYRALVLASTTAANPLPVELVSFAATRQLADAVLRWTTASELNAAYFEVQTGPDGRTWQSLGQLPATGTSRTAQNYTFIDKNPARYGTPLVYYRLRQVDQDATSHFSPVRTLAPTAPDWELTAYPNPYAQDLSAQLTSSESGPITLTLLDAAGHTLLRQQAAGGPGTQLIALPTAAAVPTGAYVLRVQQNGHTGTVRVVRR